MRLKRSTPSAAPEAKAHELAGDGTAETLGPALLPRTQGLRARLGLDKSDASNSAQTRPMLNPLGWFKRDARKTSDHVPDTPWHGAPGWAAAQEALRNDAPPARIGTTLRREAHTAANAALTALDHLAQQRAMPSGPTGHSASQQKRIEKAEQAVALAMPRVRKMREAMDIGSGPQPTSSPASASPRLKTKD